MLVLLFYVCRSLHSAFSAPWKIRRFWNNLRKMFCPSLSWPLKSFWVSVRILNFQMFCNWWCTFAMFIHLFCLFLGQNISRLFDVLAEFPFSICETPLDYYLQRVNVRLVSKAAKWEKTYTLYITLVFFWSVSVCFWFFNSNLILCLQYTYRHLAFTIVKMQKHSFGDALQNMIVD